MKYYHNNASDIKFSNSENFISFFYIGDQASYCTGCEKEENTFDRAKGGIEIIDTAEINGVTYIKNDYSLKFRYDHYGFSKEIEYPITHMYSFDEEYELLYYSNTDDPTLFVFKPFERNYSENFLILG